MHAFLIGTRNGSVGDFLKDALLSKLVTDYESQGQCRFHFPLELEIYIPVPLWAVEMFLVNSHSVVLETCCAYIQPLT